MASISNDIVSFPFRSQVETDYLRLMVSRKREGGLFNTWLILILMYYWVVWKMISFLFVAMEHRVVSRDREQSNSSQIHSRNTFSSYCSSVCFDQRLYYCLRLFQPVFHNMAHSLTMKLSERTFDT